jgi:predicted nucleic acid-binding protein
VTSVFADTVYFIALLKSDDQFHEAAHEFSISDRRALLTTSAVILELGASFCNAGNRHLFLAVLAALERRKSEIVHVDESLQRRAIGQFAKRPDKSWSLTDCISFLVMEDRGILEAVTSDHHFEEAGFVALLRGERK